VGSHRAWGASSDYPHDRRTPPQLPVHVDQDPRPAAWTRGASAGQSTSDRRATLLPALYRSGAGITRLLELGCDHGGTIPPTRSYVWRNLPLDVGHVLGYFIAHEGRHRGQIVLVARALGHRLPAEVTAGLWQWTQRAAEARAVTLYSVSKKQTRSS